MSAEVVPNSGQSQIIINKEFKAEWRENVDPEIYHADKTAVNSSSLKEIRKSPFSFKRTFIEGVKKESTPAMNFGTLAHMAILEGQRFRDSYVVMPEFIGYTKDGRESKQSGEAREKKAQWIAEMQLEGRTIVTQDEYDKLMYMIDSVMANSEASKLLTNGVGEVSGYYADPETGILCRIRPDFISYDLNAMIDVKTVSSCELDWFRRNRVEDRDFMYYFQMAMYDEGCSIISNKKVDYPVWILIENDGAHECVVVPMEEVYREIGNLHYKQSLKKLKFCLDNNVWERRPTVQQMLPSNWFIESQEI